MSTTMTAPAGAAYDTLAPAYDLLTAGYAHDRWLSVLEAVAREHGLSGARLLDVACGTGKSFLPMLERGYSVTACDISPEMVAIAREKVAETNTEVIVADMRSLPPLGEFDLAFALCDVFNYLLTE